MVITAKADGTAGASPKRCWGIVLAGCCRRCDGIGVVDRGRRRNLIRFVVEKTVGTFLHSARRRATRGMREGGEGGGGVTAAADAPNNSTTTADTTTAGAEWVGPPAANNANRIVGPKPAIVSANAAEPKAAQSTSGCGVRILLLLMRRGCCVGIAVVAEGSRSTADAAADLPNHVEVAGKAIRPRGCLLLQLLLV